jgi:hypothetical protein
MGAKTAMILYANGDVRSQLASMKSVDHEKARALVARLHPGFTLTPVDDGALFDHTYPRDGLVYAASTPGLDLVCTQELQRRDYPSRLDKRFLDPGSGRTVYLHVMHSVVDWFAYAIWKDGNLVRSLSVAPDSGIVENIGDPLPFEVPYWSGIHPVEVDPGDKPYPLKFHPLELGEEALRVLFGFVLEGEPHSDDLDSEVIALAGYKMGGGSWIDRAKRLIGL